jgi:hypothetical protein
MDVGKKKVCFNCNINSAYFYLKDKNVYTDYLSDAIHFENRVRKFEIVFKSVYEKYLQSLN